MLEHLYIHIPFCHRICPYCSFHKHRPGKTDMGAFVDAIEAELKEASKLHPVRARTVYWGGGTPSLLPTEQLQRLAEGIARHADLSGLEEFTIEANPKTYGTTKAAAMAQLFGPEKTRVSLGVQSWDPPTLTTLGRDHSPQEAREAFETLRSAGIGTLNLDLMFSVPGRDLATWEKDLRESLALQPDHLSAYNLTYEEDTEFFEKLGRGEMDEDEDRDCEQFLLASQILGEAGFEHYEISNYARPGHRSLHNQAYWAGKDYLGLGPGAVSTVGAIRWRNLPNTDRYIDAEGRSERIQENLNAEQKHMEHLALGLRRREGIAREALNEEEQNRAADLAKEGLLKIDGDRVALTPVGWPLVDPIASHLLG